MFADGALTEREKPLIALGVAHAVQCPYCIDAYYAAMPRKGLEPRADDRSRARAPRAIRGGASLVHGVQMRNHVDKLVDVEPMALLTLAAVQRAPPCDRATQRRRLLDGAALARAFDDALGGAGLHPLRADRPRGACRSTSASSATRPAGTATSTPGPTGARS